MILLPKNHQTVSKLNAFLSLGSSKLRIEVSFFFFVCIFWTGSFLWSILAHRFHDPDAARVSIELLYKEMILAGQDKGAREKVTFEGFLTANFLFQILLVPFEVFDHKIFAGQLF